MSGAVCPGNHRKISCNGGFAVGAELQDKVRAVGREPGVGLVAAQRKYGEIATGLEFEQQKDAAFVAPGRGDVASGDAVAGIGPPLAAVVDPTVECRHF